MNNTNHTKTFSVERVAELLNDELQKTKAFERFADRHEFANAISSFLLSNECITMISLNSDSELSEQIEKNEDTYQLFINTICVLGLDVFLTGLYTEKPWCSPNYFNSTKTKIVYEILNHFEAHAKEEFAAVTMEAFSPEQTDMASA